MNFDYRSYRVCLKNEVEKVIINQVAYQSSCHSIKLASQYNSSVIERL